MGSYHGRASFETFSHPKSILKGPWARSARSIPAIRSLEGDAAAGNFCPEKFFLLKKEIRLVLRIWYMWKVDQKRTPIREGRRFPMELRQQQEQLEAVTLLPPRLPGRTDQRPGPSRDGCGIRTCFQRDTDRIVYSKAFPPPQAQDPGLSPAIGDHYRTRMTHTLEVSRIARTIARALALNEGPDGRPSPWATTWATPLRPRRRRLLNELMPGGSRPLPAVPSGGGPPGEGTGRG